ncbi:MAG: GC-type dockerin domain-anchored protein [Planctomycetota bacterium]|nr:GC-type dockerin domain-anchored protein [Planctomycetota bacterium]
MHTCQIALIQCALLGIASASVHADTWHVPDDFPTIQEALDAASADDTILVGPGTYYESLDFDNKNMILMSTDGLDSTFIDGSNTTASLVQMVHCGSPARVQGFTFQNADGGTPVGQDETIIVGGGIRVLAGQPVIEDCHFINCHSGYGGGIHSGGSNVSVINCSFLNCSASANAGGLLVINGLGTIEGCYFEGNHATLMGGAIHIVNGDGHAIHDSEIINNTAIDGAGISWHNIQTGFGLDITGCNISGNSATNAGGGIRSVAGSAPVSFTDSILCDNNPDEIIGPFVDNGGNTLCVCPADINGNGIVESDDILIVVAQWATSGPQGDINQDGIVDISDLLEALATFGPCANF